MACIQLDPPRPLDWIQLAASAFSMKSSLLHSLYFDEHRRTGVDSHLLQCKDLRSLETISCLPIVEESIAVAISRATGFAGTQ